MSIAPTHILDVSGPFACFSNPAGGKVERFSYSCPTPSAARGIFDAIFCHPLEFRWEIVRIEVLNPLRYIALRRNEVKDKANVATIGKWMAGKTEPEPIWADGDSTLLGTDQKGRTQRQTMALMDVRYRMHARIRPWPGHEDGQRKFDECFRRRARLGKCVWQPCFGVREFPAYFEPVDDVAAREPAPFPLDQNLGLMLYDVFDLSRPGKPIDTAAGERPFISLFKAAIRSGTLDVPPFESPEVLKPAKDTI